MHPWGAFAAMSAILMPAGPDISSYNFLEQQRGCLEPKFGMLNLRGFV